MKKILCILLILIFAFPLASCGSANEYTYDYLPLDYPVVISTIRSQSHAIKGGAYLNMNENDLEGEEFVGSHLSLRSIFNEETKTITSLCWDMTCDHTSLDCFGKMYGLSPRGCTGIYEDSVFCIMESADTKNQLEAVYYGFDGVILETVEYSPELTMPNGEVFEDTFYMMDSHFKYGTKLYFDLYAYASGADASALLQQWELEYVHWFVSYDLETKKWDLVASPSELFSENIIMFNDAKDDKLEFSYNGVEYVVDTNSGEICAYDCTTILDEMIAAGKVPAGSLLGSVCAVRDYFVCNTETERLYCRISTKELVKASELDVWGTGTDRKFVYNGEQYVFEYGEELDRDLWVNVETGEGIPFGLDGMALMFFSETENGIIFRYLERLEDGSLEPETYTVKENYKEVTYWYPQKYVYVTKEDILDGQIDEPWYYDSETYSFVRE